MPWLKKFIAPVFLIIFSLASVWPCVVNFTDGVVEEYDGMIMVWEMNQTISKIPYALANVFQSNIFYPFENTLAFTHLLIPSAFLSFVPVRLTGSFIVASNFTIIFGQVVSSLIIYLWLKDISGSKYSSFIGSVALILSKIRFNFLVHLQMWTMHWWLIPSWLFWRYFKYKNVKDLYLGFVFMGIAIWENVLPIYLIATILVCLVVVNFSFFRKNIKHFILGSIVSLVIMLPVVIVYRQVSIAHGFMRTIRDAAHFSGSIDGLAEKSFSPLLFTLFGLALFKLGKDKKVVSTNTNWIFLVFTISFFFYLGPVFKWGGETVKLLDKVPIPLPYSVFYYIVPGLNALRSTSRWILLSAFSIVALFSYAFRDLNFKKNKLTAVILLYLAFLNINRIENIHPVSDKENIPEVYKWLSGTEYESILELPMYTWTDRILKKNEYYRLYYSLFHEKKMVGGVSGFMPKETSKLLASSRKAGSIDQITRDLKFFNPDLIIIHKGQYVELLGRDLDFASFTKDAVWEDENTLVINFN